MILAWLWCPVLLYTAFIFWLSSAPRPIPGIRLFPWIDKVYHLVEYAPWGSLLTRALRRSPRRSWPWGSIHAGATVGAVVVGFLDEWYQRFTPLRVSSVWDALCDVFGAAIGQLWYRARSR